MYQEIQLCSVKGSDSFTHSNVTLVDTQEQEHQKCMDDTIILEVGQFIYIAKISNGNSVILYQYNVKDFLAPQLTTEYIHFSHLITQNGCALLQDTDSIPYLFVVTQSGEIYYKNLLTQQSHIIKNLLGDNQRIRCFAKKLATQTKELSFYLISDNTLHHITIDVVKGEFWRLKYQLSFGWFKSVEHWKTAFEINPQTILHYSFQTQFTLLEKRDQEFTTRNLNLPENVKIKQIEVFFDSEYHIAYIVGSVLNIYSLTSKKYRPPIKLGHSDPFKLTSLEGTLFIVQQQIQQIVNEDLQAITKGDQVIGFSNKQDFMCVFYKKQISLLSSIKDKVSIIETQLNIEIQKLKENAHFCFRLKDEELMIQNKYIDDLGIEDPVRHFQVLIKLMHRNLPSQLVLQLIKEQGNNFIFENLISKIMLEIEDIYIYLKPQFRKLLNVKRKAKKGKPQDGKDKTQVVKEQIVQYLEGLENYVEEILRKQQVQYISDGRFKSVLKKAVKKQLEDYYHQFLECYLGLAVLCDIKGLQFELDCQYQLFYQVTRLLCMINSKESDFFQQIFNKSYLNLKDLTNTAKFLIGIIAHQPIPHEYISEAFVVDQQKSIIDNNDAFQLIRFYRISQQTEEVSSNAVHFITHNQDQYQELKFRVAFLLHKKSDNSDEQNQIHQSLIFYAEKLRLYQFVEGASSKMIEDNEFMNFQFSAQTLNQVSDQIIQQARKYNKFQDANIILQYFTFLLKNDQREKAYTILLEYIINLELVLFSLKGEQLKKCVSLQLDYLNLLTNQMALKSPTDDDTYCDSVVCRLSDQSFKQFRNPECIVINEQQPLNFQIIHISQIMRFLGFKKIQNYVCEKYQPQSSCDGIIEQLIQHNDKKLEDILPYDFDVVRTLAFNYFVNKNSEILDRVELEDFEKSIMLAELCVSNNLTVEEIWNFYLKAPEQEHFFQYLINVDREQIALKIMTYKESGVLKSWSERLLIYDLPQLLLRYIDVKAQTQKQLLIQNYIIHPVTFHQGKWSIKLKTPQDIEPRVVRFGWNNQSEALQWFDYFNGKYWAGQIREKKLEEWDLFKPESERVVNQTIPQMLIKPSNRMRQMIPLLPEFLQNDIELILENTHENLQGFSDIHSFNKIHEARNAEIYQDPKDNLHMRFFFKSEMSPTKIYDELSMHTFIDNWSPLVSIYQVYPAKKDCAVIYTEFDLEKKSEQRPKSLQNMDQEIVLAQSFGRQPNQMSKIRLIYTQKHFQIDENAFCIIKKYTGKEIYHNQFDKDKSEGTDEYKITRSCLLIQPIFDDRYKTQIIEDIYLDCQDKEMGEEVMKRFLLNFENIDNQILEADHYIKQKTEHVLIKNEDDIDNLQISFIEPEVQRITSEQHQQQSIQEYHQILNSIQSGKYICEAIRRKFNQNLLQGLDKQLESTKEDGHFLYTKYYEVDPKKGGLIYLNKKLISDQRSVLLDIIKRMGSNLLSGKSLMSVSLPIQVFESRSFLERMARAQGHAPIFLEQAANSNDIFEQMKQSVAFYISSFMMGVQQEKPFNPILGETFEGRIKGCPIYLEQTSHHPPVSNFLMYGRGYKIQGAFCPVVNMGTNSLAGEQQGHSLVHYSNNNLKFYYIAQPFMLYGVLLGQRSVNCHKRSYCFQPDHQLLVELTFNPKDKNAGFFGSSSQKIDFFTGRMCKVTPECIQKCLKAHKTNSGIKLKIQPQDVLDTYNISIKGRWTCYLQFDNTRYWDIEVDRPYILELESFPLPSDCLYRLDLLYMKMKEMSKGQDMKEQMEVDQRKDKNLREKNANLRKKKKQN